MHLEIDTISSKTVLEELASFPTLTDAQWQMVDTCRNEPAFILGQDIDRASAFHFNKAIKDMEEYSAGKAETWERYMRMVHPEEFEEDSERKGEQITIKIGVGLLEAI